MRLLCWVDSFPPLSLYITGASSCGALSELLSTTLDGMLEPMVPILRLGSVSSEEEEEEEEEEERGKGVLLHVVG